MPATGDMPTHRRRVAVGLALAVLLTAVASGGGAATAQGARATGPVVRVPSHVSSVSHWVPRTVAELYCPFVR